MFETRYLKLVSATIGVGLVAVLNVPVALAQAPGDLLFTWNEDLGGTDTFNSMKVRNGKVVVAGTTDVNGSEDLVLLQYQIPGGFGLDPAFNGGTPIIHDSVNGPGQASSGDWVDLDGIDTNADQVDDDYEIYVGGTFFGAAAFPGALKFSSTGVQDQGWGAFNGEGLLCADSFGPDGFATDAGEVFVTGEQIANPLVDSYFLTGKFLATGMGDAVFGNGGCQVEFVVGGLERGVATMDYDGMVLTVGNTSQPTGTDVHMIRYQNNGALDPGFGGGTGKVTTASITVGGIGYLPHVKDGVVMRRNNARRIVVAGLGILPGGVSQELFLVRYRGNGNLDTAFGAAGTGVVADSFGLAGISPIAVTVDRNLNIIVAGDTPTGLWIARYDLFGVLDPAFGVGGVVTTAGFENVRDVLMAPNGLDIVIVGNDNNDGLIMLFKG